MHSNTIPKAELYQQLKRFFDDQDRGISIALFAELAGLTKKTLIDIFYRGHTMSERSQIRLSKAYNAWKNGEVKVMQNRDRTRFVEYRVEPKPVMVRSNKIVVENGKLRLALSPSNPRDYSGKTLDEQLRGR
jgi:hypothetical protein